MKIETTGRIQVRSSKVGSDTVFLVTGGKAHVGGGATAYVADRE